MRFITRLLFIVLFVYCSSIAFAADLRYESITTGGTVVAQFDKDTLRYEKDPYRDEKLLSVWIKTFSTIDNSSYNLTHYLFRFNDPAMLQLETLEYNEIGQLTNKTNAKYNPELWVPILPETPQETWYAAALKYAKDNTILLQKSYSERVNTGDTHNRTLFPFITDIFNLFTGGN